jgi:hypothetical protein
VYSFIIAKGLLLSEEKVVRWTERQNTNHSVTIIIEIKGPQEDGSDWLILVEVPHMISFKDLVHADAFAFSERVSNGMYDFYFCAKGATSSEWVWDGTR